MKTKLSEKYSRMVGPLADMPAACWLKLKVWTLTTLQKWGRPIAAWIYDDEDAVRRCPGNGYRVVPMLLRAETVQAADELYGDFAASANQVARKEVLATYLFKRDRLLARKDFRRTIKDWPYEAMWVAELEEMWEDNELMDDDLIMMVGRLEEKYPDA